MARGRPRKCDPDDVLNAALDLFWTHGYAATSMNDVARETGMAKPGLYANFGSKDQLFEKTLRSYFGRFTTGAGADFLASTAPIDEAVRDLLVATTAGLLEKPEPCGCFQVKTLMETAGKETAGKETTGREAAPAQVCREISANRDAILEQRVTRAQDAGELPDTIPARQFAGFISAQMMAIGAMVAEGRGRDEIDTVIDMAVAALPVVRRETGA